MGINIPQVIKNKKRSSFPFHLKCLNLKEKKGISETNNKDIKIIVDYNGKLAKKIIEYIQDVDTSASTPPLPSF